MSSFLLALLLVTLPGRPETLCLRLSSCGTRGMVCEKVVIQMIPRIWQWVLICITKRKENQGVIRAFLEYVALNQVRLIDHNTGLLNEGNGVPIKDTHV